VPKCLKKIDGFKSHNIIRLVAERMSFLSCLLGKRPSKWLTVREKLLILMRFFLLILACVQKHNKQGWYNFYNDMDSFVKLAKEYLSKYESLTDSEKKSYQNSLHEILKRMSHNHTYVIGGTWGQSWTLRQLFAFYRAVKREVERKPFPGEVSYSGGLPLFSYSSSSDRTTYDEIKRELFGVFFNLPSEMCQAFPVIFKSDSHSQPLNVHPPIVLNPIVKVIQPSNKSPGILWGLNRETGKLEPYGIAPAIHLEQLQAA